MPDIRWSRAMTKAYKAAGKASRKKEPSPGAGAKAGANGEGLSQFQVIKCPKCDYDIVIDPFWEKSLP